MDVLPDDRRHLARIGPVNADLHHLKHVLLIGGGEEQFLAVIMQIQLTHISPVLGRIDIRDFARPEIEASNLVLVSLGRENMRAQPIGFRGDLIRKHNQRLIEIDIRIVGNQGLIFELVVIVERLNSLRITFVELLKDRRHRFDKLFSLLQIVTSILIVPRLGLQNELDRAD